MAAETICQKKRISKEGKGLTHSLQMRRRRGVIAGVGVGSVGPKSLELHLPKGEHAGQFQSGMEKLDI